MRKILLVLIQLVINLTMIAQTDSKYASSNINLRKEPNTSGKVLAIIPKGTEVKLAENCDCEWIRVLYDGHTGYVYSKYLTNSKVVPLKTTYTSDSAKEVVKYYTNSTGERIQSPTHYSSAPAGATALCRDGTYSFSQNRRGTCSHHGGVSKWLK